MNGIQNALWTEGLKFRRSKVPMFVTLGFSIAPLVSGFFMVILKDPEAARSMGLISTKAQITAGTADWPSFFNMLSMAAAIGGAILFAILTAWVFGREFSDNTAKDFLAVPTGRETVLLAKFTLVTVWALTTAVLIFAIGVVIGSLVEIPGWSVELFRSSLVDIEGAAIFTIALLPYVALTASVGRGYLPAIGWTILTVALAQIAIVIGWGDWFPWSIPALFSGAAGPRAGLLGLHSYLVLAFTSALGFAATFYWWRYADQTR